jgi:hypothetical protein
MTRSLLITAFLGAASLEANYGGGDLRGKELAPIRLRAGRGNATPPDTPAGSIDRALVTDDGAGRLVVSVRYANWPDREIQGELLSDEMEVQPWFGRPTAGLSTSSGEIELVFETGSRVPEDAAALISAYLRVRVLRKPPLESPRHGLRDVLREALPHGGQRDRRAPIEMERAFSLHKRWDESKSAEAGANVVVRITPRPIGAAAQLREQAAAIAPPPMVPTASPASNGSTTSLTGRTLNVRGAVLVSRAVHVPLDAQGARVDGVAPRAPAGRTSTTALTSSMTAGIIGLGVPSAVKDKDGKGPGQVPFDLLQGLRSDVSLELDSVLRISTRVYQDQNPESGIFYFLPQSYSLAWTPTEGYGLRMLYSAAKDSGAGEVLVAARLDAGVASEEIQLATALLRAYQARRPGMKFTELRALPIDEAPKVSLAGGLQHQYNIPAEKIVINALSDALGQIDVSWVSDTVTKENVQLALTEDVGLSGSVTLVPAGGVLPAHTLPIRIQLAHASTLGPIPWRRHESWQNATPYPVRLRYLHVLLLEGGTPLVYSWNLNGATVAPQGVAKLDAAPIPSWLDARALRMWIEYAPLASCEECDKQVIAAITGGVTSMGASQITFHTITPIVELRAQEISISVRSRYFDPRSRQLQTKATLSVHEDNKDFTLGPIYLVNRQSGEVVPGDPLFEYRLDITMPDGSSHRGETWTPVDGLRVLIGRVQVEQVLSGSAGGSK